MVEIDKYIDWANARKCLIDVLKSTEKAISLCNSILLSAHAEETSDDVIANIIGNINLTEEQVLQISRYYTKLIGDIKFNTEPLNNSEVTDDAIFKK